MEKLLEKLVREFFAEPKWNILLPPRPDEVRMFMKHPRFVRHLVETAASPKFVPPSVKFKSKAAFRMTAIW